MLYLAGMPLIQSLVSWFLRKRLAAIRYAAEHPHEVQEVLLKSLLKQASLTEWGRQHGFASIKTPQQFAQRVPLQDYESLRPYIHRMLRGEQNILWAGTVRWFAKSSGTMSDRSKFIPVSSEGLSCCHLRGGRDAVAVYCHNHPETRIFTGRALLMGGSHRIHELNDAIRVGDISAVMMQNMPHVAHWMKTPDLSVALLDDWEQKLHRMTQITSQQYVTQMAGVPTWTLVLLRNILQLTGKQNIKEVWPGLELYIHGGVSFTPYRNQFARLIDPVNMHYLETYNASEGFFAFQDAEAADDMLLLTNNGVYYEFLDTNTGKCLSLGDTEKGKVYSLVITTNSGLWRYQIGDTVRITSVNPYKIQVAGRVKHFINVFGEEVMIHNTDRALAEACEKTGALVTDYTVAPIFFEGSSKGGHEWAIEFKQPPDDLEKFRKILDEALRAINSDYDAKR
ncbi:MAG: hypothetical protein KatS3mg031_1515 [Chitinophagales bacterium]|nr:MAG: hypothetical protein KatS3mg031_1515 [Chitinophagales bacterium]